MNTNQQTIQQTIQQTNQQTNPTINEKVLNNIVTEMITAKFNNMNPLVHNILNHVNFESSIAREVPNVQSKLDILASQGQPSMDNLIATSQTGVQPVQQVQAVQAVQPVQQVQPVQPVQQVQAVQQTSYITYAKIGIITIAIICILCVVAYMYIPEPYNYVVMCVAFAAALASDYFIVKTYCM